MEPARQKTKPDSLLSRAGSEGHALARLMVSMGAKALSDKGASKGGHARAASLSPKRRTEIATQAAQVRWLNKPN